MWTHTALIRLSVTRCLPIPICSISSPHPSVFYLYNILAYLASKLGTSQSPKAAHPSVMSESKIGGEYGEVRAEIDVQALNKYLAQYAKEVKVPVEVKQFKVSCLCLYQMT
ncbi:hypothetical protein FRC12_015893 [Ceratobasidium sp. 428]|nr:hypothetical protein FRC12_015893 [Ceratobasidium sp. 428]